MQDKKDFIVDPQDLNNKTIVNPLSTKENVYKDGYESIDLDTELKNLKIDPEIDIALVNELIEKVKFPEFTKRLDLDNAIAELDKYLADPNTLDKVSDHNVDVLSNLELVETKLNGLPDLNIQGTGVLDRLLFTTLKALQYMENLQMIDRASIGEKFIQLYAANLQSAVQYTAQMETLKVQEIQANAQKMLAQMQALQIKAQILHAKIDLENSFLDGKIKESQYALSKVQLGMGTQELRANALKEIIMRKQIDAADLTNINLRQDITEKKVNIDIKEISKEIECKKSMQADVQLTASKYQIADEVDGKPISGLLKIQRDTALEQKIAIRRSDNFKLIQSILTAWGITKSADPTVKTPDCCKAVAIDKAIYYHTKSYLDIVSPEQFRTYFGVSDTYSEYLDPNLMDTDGGKATNVEANVLRPYYDPAIDPESNAAVETLVYDTALKLVPFLNDSQQVADKLNMLDQKARGAIIKQSNANKLKFEYGQYLYTDSNIVPAILPHTEESITTGDLKTKTVGYVTDRYKVVK